MKLIDEAFVTQCESAAKEYQDVQFSLYAIYSGDAEPVRVSRERELFLIKTEDGVFLFG
jgi:hypothetical protein